MRVYAIDFETYFDDDYQLGKGKLTTEEYVRGDMFAVHGAAIVGPGVRRWMNEDELNEQFEVWREHSKRGGEPIALVAHHAQFDGLILSHHFDYRPDVWLCTLSMGRVVFGSGLKLKLEDLAQYFNLAPKSVPYHLFKGKMWYELNQWEQSAVAEGCLHDAELTLTICSYMISGGHSAVPVTFPLPELPVVDLTIRMFTEPCLVGDLNLLGQAWTDEFEARKDLFARLSEVMGYEIDDRLLRKDDQFAAMLEALGIEPETKITAKGNEKYAFAKSDYFMQDLLVDEDEDVSLLTEARLKAHSSIYQTRAERFGFIATRGPIPIYLAYGAAHTRRWGGGDKQNAQNFPRPDPYNPKKGALRRAIKAP
jgi:hypothetical protein